MGVRRSDGRSGVGDREDSGAAGSIRVGWYVADVAEIARARALGTRISDRFTSSSSHRQIRYQELLICGRIVG
jgi:hypothetical protein